MNFISSRLPALKFLAVAGCIQLGVTFFSNASGTTMYSVSEYMQAHTVNQNSPFIITGVLKPRSVKVNRGLQKKFKITDYSYDINCVYEGESKGQFREGQLLVLQSYCPNVSKKDHIIIKTYLTKHSMQSNEWEKRGSVDKQSYGLQTAYN